MSNETPAKFNTLTSMSQLLERYKAQINAAIPPHMTAERLIRIALTAVSQTTLLQKCDVNTLCGAVVQSSILGLEPNSVLGEAFLVPYWNSKASRYEAQLQIGYRGHCKLARNSGEIAMIDAQGVREQDEFDFVKGDVQSLRHKWPKTGSRGELIGYWAGYRTRSGEFNFEYWPMDDIEAHRDHYSKGAFLTEKGKRVMKDDKPVLQGPWLDSPDWMYKKTVLIQALKLAPKSVHMQTALDLDARADAGIPQVFSPEIPVDLSPARPDPGNQTDAEPEQPQTDNPKGA